MQRYGVLAAAAVVAALVPAMMISGSTPASAVTAKQKMETCKFGADDQKLAGAARAAFMKKCMSNKNDPRGPSAATPAATGAPAGPDEDAPPND
jgi:hypothetical protein